jgi:signal peptidase I
MTTGVNFSQFKDQVNRRTVMADCSSTAGIHLIVEKSFLAKNLGSPFVHMLSLELCERLGTANPATQSSPAVENGDAVGNAPVVGQGLLAEGGPAAANESGSNSTPSNAAGSNAGDTNTPNTAGPLAGKWRSWRFSTRRLIFLGAIVLGVRIFVGEASVVPTASMEGTILVGDHLFMDKLLYGPEIPLVHWRLPALKTIHRGDIIVFRYPKDPSETFLKRVTAMGGDRLEIRDGVLYVNLQPVQEPYAVHHAPVHSPEESWGPTVVPEGKLFVMGDNRDNSSDSRDWGFVPVSNVIGEPLFVYWSYDAPTSRWLDENMGHRISFYASIAGNFFSHTRWNRTGMLL